MPDFRLLGSLRGAVFGHDIVSEADEMCRRAADRSVLGIDGQYSTLLKSPVPDPIRFSWEHLGSACIGSPSDVVSHVR